jgi:hypothetical protein
MGKTPAAMSISLEVGPGCVRAGTARLQPGFSFGQGQMRINEPRLTDWVICKKQIT